MPQLSFASADVPKTIENAALPMLTQSTLTIPVPTTYPVSTLENIYLTMNVTPPSDGASKLNIYVGPDSVVQLDNLTCLHHSYQGNLFLGGVTYPTNRQVYAIPLYEWIGTIQNESSITWTLSLYNWADVTGTLTSWSMVYYYGADPTPAASPLNPAARGLASYYGPGSGFRRVSNHTRKIGTCEVGMVDAPIPIQDNLSKLGNAVVSIKNDDPAGDIGISLYNVASDGVMNQLVSLTTLVEQGYNSFYFPSYNEYLSRGDHLFYTIDSTAITNASLAIQTAVMGG